MSGEHDNNGSSIEQTYQPRLDPEKVAYWESRANEVLDLHTRIFREFTSEYRPLITIGDRRIRRFLSSGFDIFLQDQDFPVQSSEKLMFYANYIGNTDHFGLLLAELEDAIPLAREKITFGVKASKAVLKWTLDQENEQRSHMDRIRRSGEKVPTDLSGSVQTVVIFKDITDDEALAIAMFLVNRASSSKEGAIPKSWDFADVRATASLHPVLGNRLIPAVANVFTAADGTGKLLILTQLTSFSKAWQKVRIPVHEDLFGFLKVSEELP